MYFSGFAEGKTRQGSSVVELVQEFCKNQCRKYSKPCTKPHTGTPTGCEHDFFQDSLCQGFQTPKSSGIKIEPTVFFSREYDIEGDMCPPVDNHRNKHIVLQYPFLKSSNQSGSEPSTSDTIEDFLDHVKGFAERTGSKGLGKDFSREKIDENKNTERESISTSQTFKYNMGGPSSENGQRGTNSSSGIDERPDSLELDTIIEETEGDDQQSGSWKSDTKHSRDVRNKKAKGKGRRARILEAYDNYPFDEMNPMLDLEDPFREALRKMSESNLTMAILYLEASVQRKPQYSLPKHSTSWMFLGLCQAANEQDVLAIAAFRECVKLELENQNALMSLAVSYANENERNLAIHTLWRWLYNEPSYCDLVNIPEPVDASELSEPLDLEIYEKVFQLFLRVGCACEKAFIDPNIQGAIGIMYCLIGEFWKASKHFHTAVLVRPKDERLWNRLGASLANNRRHDEAILAFSNALDLEPGYVRARFNLAISCSKMGNNKEAIQHLLKALNSQVKSAKGLVGRTSDCIWSSLKTLVTMLGEPTLDEAIEKRDLRILNEAFGVE